MSYALLETFCTVCGRQWQPTRAHFTRGLWRVCDDCRGTLTADRTPAGGDDPDALPAGAVPDRTGDTP